MTQRQYSWLRADLAELDRLLEMTPEMSVINRNTLEYRRSQVLEEIEAFPVPKRWPATGSIAFYGAPVEDGRGVDADFLGQAIKTFSSAVALAGASQRGQLMANGPVRNREELRLLITGTAAGSFILEIEEASSGWSDASDSSPVELGIRHLMEIIEASVKGEWRNRDPIPYAHPRALAALLKFLKLMASNHAFCSLSFQDDVFAFEDAAQVRRSVANLRRGLEIQSLSNGHKRLT